MKIRSDSWHFRLVRHVFGDTYFLNYNTYTHKFIQKTLSLCPYFWSMVLAAISLPFVEAWRALPKRTRNNLPAIIAVGLLFFAMGVLIYTLYISFRSSFVYGAISIGAIIGGFLAGRRMSSWIRRKKELPEAKPEKKKPKQPNILAEYVKAKKERICPILDIEWVSSKEDELLK